MYVSIVHLLDGYIEFINFYLRCHDRIVNKIAEFIKEYNPKSRISSNLLVESIFPEFKERIKQIVHRKPDIVILNGIQRQCSIVDITVCYDLYQEKVRRFKELCDYLERNGFSVRLIVLCFSSLGYLKGDVWKGLIKLSQSNENIKNMMEWCSTLCVIGGSYIWRNRFKKSLRQ